MHRAVREIKAVTLFMGKWAGTVVRRCLEAQPGSAQDSSEGRGGRKGGTDLELTPKGSEAPKHKG